MCWICNWYCLCGTLSVKRTCCVLCTNILSWGRELIFLLLSTAIVWVLTYGVYLMPLSGYTLDYGTPLTFHLIIQNTINPYLMNGLSDPNHLDEATFILGASEVIFHFHFIF